MGLKLRKGLAILLGSILLTGCSGLYFADIQDAMVPPNMTERQDAIYQVLRQTSGENIKLKYPRSGESRSAIVMQDFDGDGVEEAVAFYQSTAVNANPHVFLKLLKNNGTAWTVVADLEGEGSDIDRVVFGTSTENNERFMAVGYDVANKTDRLFRIYAYNGGEVTLEASRTYSVLETFDLDEDGNDELLFVEPSDSAYRQSNARGAAVYAGMIRRIGGRFITVSKTTMDAQVYDYVKTAKGRLKNGRPALYLDGQRNVNQLSTEILCERKGKLENLIYQEDGGLIEQTCRESVPIADINGDRVYDIPQAYTMGTEGQSDSQQRLTDWYNYQGGALKKMMSSYVNSADGYIFSIPPEWEYRVGVERDAARRAVTFYAYENDNAMSRAILTIRAQKRNADDDEASDGAVYICSNGQLSYYATLPQSVPAAYRLTVKQIKSNLIIS